MISFEQFKIEDGYPIYTQIIQYIKRGIVAGRIRNQDEVPSRRVLSSLIGVNPNTVQKAYRMLEGENIIESRSGAISYVTVDASKIASIRSQLLEGDLGAVVKAMKQMGISKEEALRLMAKLWD